MRVKPKDRITLATISGIFLLPLSIENQYTIPLIFISFIPLFYLAQEVTSWKKYLLLSILIVLAFSIRWYHWIIGSGYYIKFALLLLSNSIIYLIPFILLKYVSKAAFIYSWIGVEVFHLHTSIGSPITVLGNYLSFGVEYIQWYELTGVLGGSIYILLGNYFIWFLVRSTHHRRPIWVVFLLLFITAPFIVSYYLKSNITFGKTSIDIVSLNTDLNARKEKYVIKERVLINQYIKETKEYLSDSTRLIIWPETALFTYQKIKYLTSNKKFNSISERLGLDSTRHLVTGAILEEHFYKDSIKNYSSDLIQSLSPNQLYRLYNTMILIPYENGSYRNKSRLVPFNEYKPDHWLGRLLFDIDQKNLFTFSKFRPGKQVFSFGEHIELLPLICFEVLFGDNLGKLKNNANLISVSFNEGWYDSERGSKLFNFIARCRAIENRSYIITSSNCGYSSIISPTGKLTTEFVRNKSVAGKVFLTNTETLYNKLGDKGVIVISTIIFLVINQLYRNKLIVR